MYYCYILTVIIVITAFLLYNEKKKNERLNREVKRLKQEIKNLREALNLKEERIKEEVENILKITEGYSKYEDGKLYLTGEALKRLKTEWKVSRDEIKKKLEDLGLELTGRTTKSINGEVKHAYIYILKGGIKK